MTPSLCELCGGPGPVRLIQKTDGPWFACAKCGGGAPEPPNPYEPQRPEDPFWCRIFRCWFDGTTCVIRQKLTVEEAKSVRFLGIELGPIAEWVPKYPECGSGSCEQGRLIDLRIGSQVLTKLAHRGKKQS